MTPYYHQEGITIYHADCLDVLPQLDKADVILTDPVWPGCEAIFPGIDAYDLLARAAAFFPQLCSRLIVVLGCDIDPRFLQAIPSELPFFRLCWMRFIPPRYRGSLLAGSDVAYIFGKGWLSGQSRVLPGETHAVWSKDTPRRHRHPCCRNESHMRWLISNYVRPDHVLLDPFMGAGTTLVAAKKLGIRAVGIEKEQRYCDFAIKRLSQKMLCFEPIRGGL